MIYIRNWSGQVIKARCKHCSHCLRELIGCRVYYLGVCYYKAGLPGSEGILAQPIGVNNLACENFSPQPSFEIINFVQTKLQFT